jgi:hypothetical protein
MNEKELEDESRKSFECFIEMKGELARWKAIAIEERAIVKTIYLGSRGETHPGTLERAARHTGYDADIEDTRGNAAKELNLQIGQEAGYLKRLEGAYVDLMAWVLYERDGKPIPVCIRYDGEEEQAQAALAKIREG